MIPKCSHSTHIVAFKKIQNTIQVIFILVAKFVLVHDIGKHFEAGRPSQAKTMETYEHCLHLFIEH